MTLEDFKPNGNYDIIVEDTITGEIYIAVPEKAIADIVSAFGITNEQALKMLEDQWQMRRYEIDCDTTKHARFWVERKDVR